MISLNEVEKKVEEKNILLLNYALQQEEELCTTAGRRTMHYSRKKNYALQQEEELCTTAGRRTMHYSRKKNYAQQQEEELCTTAGRRSMHYSRKKKNYALQQEEEVSSTSQALLYNTKWLFLIILYLLGCITIAAKCIQGICLEVGSLYDYR